jgi:hypothetical protein
MAAQEGLRLSLLPADAQASILSFLPHGDLAHFSQASQGSQGVAAMDRLWRPLLLQCFGDVVIPIPLLSIPALQQFRTLALSLCATCHGILLASGRGGHHTRYMRPHSCHLCGALHCAHCHCQCQCLDFKCINAITGPITHCESCQGWAHYAFDEVVQCADCELQVCCGCGDFEACMGCQDLLCYECGVGLCNECLVYSSSDDFALDDDIIGR